MMPGIARETQTSNRAKLVLGACQLTEEYKLSAALYRPTIASVIGSLSLPKHCEISREIARSALMLQNGSKLKAAQELRTSLCRLHHRSNRLDIKRVTEAQ